MKHLLLTLLLAVTGPALAGSRTSATSAITTETVDSGGLATASSTYASISSVGGIVGISTNETTEPVVLRHGYIGQIYDLLGFGILATNHYPPEEGTTQMIPLLTTDDGTYASVLKTDVIWSVLSGPASGISLSGVVSTTAVHGDATAMIRGNLNGAIAELPLHVQDTIPDNFGTYAGDGLADSWQFQHFGADNPLAGPLVDADHDGQDNLFEFIAGLLPLDPHSRFLLNIQPVPGQPGQMQLVFSPRFADRSYAVKSAATLPGTIWQDLSSLTTTDDADTRTVTDLEALGDRKFYKVEISQP
jgi:hypothetical protein